MDRAGQGVGLCVADGFNWAYGCFVHLTDGQL